MADGTTADLVALPSGGQVFQQEDEFGAVAVYLGVVAARGPDGHCRGDLGVEADFLAVGAGQHGADAGVGGGEFRQESWRDPVAGQPQPVHGADLSGADGFGGHGGDRATEGGGEPFGGEAGDICRAGHR
ncbi:hypothetical protein NLM24_23440 [Nocardia zapadnayensis]|uniref:hypothetical protein n=1 Tax=Nocardia rhamnosiphila TaxID=426716 RepID=UPI0022475894|nr:hypothetical protein [Nocardia zapadnayensis]MCX0273591.1 hypothetical protein [Nocardia zapadnayensis]